MKRRAATGRSRLRTPANEARAPSAEHQWRLGVLETNFARLKMENEQLLTQVAHIRHSHEHFAKVFEQAPVSLLVINDLGSILDWNASARRFLQLPRGATSGCFFGQFLARGSRAVFLRLLRDCANSARTVSASVTVEKQTGAWVPVLLTVGPFRQEQTGRRISQFCLSLLEESERKLIEQKLEQREKAYQDFLNSINAVLWEAEPQTLKRTYVSKEIERLLGYSAADWLRETDFWLKHIHVDDRERVMALTLQSVAVRQNFTCEYRLHKANRDTVWVRERVTILEEDSKLKLRGVIVDVSESREAQQKLQEAHEKLEQRVQERTAELQATVKELEAVSYTLSHDLRAPLRSMHGYAELVEEMSGEHLSPEAREYLHRIGTSAFRLDSLIQDVLKYSRMSQAPLEARPVDVENLIRQVLTEYSVFQSGEADIQIESPLSPVMGHEGFLTQCVSNLLSNAVKFVPKDKKPCVRVYARRIGEQIQLCFQDNGIGIEPKDQRRIFRIFQRLNPAKTYEGTGIGLAIVQRAAERMGGQAGVESSPGRGSTFWLKLPRGPT